MPKRKLFFGEKNVAAELKNQDAMWKDKIKEEAVTALKNHDQKLVDVLRYLVSLIDKRGLALPPEKMTEAEEIAVLRKELKNKEESREMFLKAGRQDLVLQLDFEIEVVKKYLPKEMDEVELRKVVETVTAETEKNFGIVMREVMKKVGGQASGEAVARIVKEVIG
ncbi:MAG: GatB/YqeY domain-containing protein [Candidatus Shapirobacteria bacterium]